MIFAKPAQRNNYIMRHDLSDVTFLIPLHLDWPQRLRNARHVITYLSENFSTNIMVGEQNEARVAPALGDLGTRFESVCFKSDAPRFHRTQLLNRMLEYVSTPFVSNYDCDMIFPLRQYLQAAQLLRWGAADFVFPYDGCFYDVAETSVERLVSALPEPRLQSLLNSQAAIALEKEFELSDRLPSHNPLVGGAFLARTAAYRQSGMENEHCIGWGSEDYERLARFQTLGFRVMRVPGHCYHLDHPRGEKGPAHHAHFTANVAECTRISAMKPDELRREIASWPWMKAATPKS